MFRAGGAGIPNLSAGHYAADSGERAAASSRNALDDREVGIGDRGSVTVSTGSDAAADTRRADTAATGGTDWRSLSEASLRIAEALLGGVDQGTVRIDL